jgi:hypothetical protein
MNTRPFGKTGFWASEIGLGCRQIGRKGRGSIDDRQGGRGYGTPQPRLSS